MKSRLLSIALGLSFTFPLLPAQTPATPPARATERPEPEEVAKLKSGPALPYKVDPTWAKLPVGYNFGECSGVDVDKQGNVWVFNRGHWPLIQLDRSGKMLKAFSTDALHFVSTHGIRVAPDGNLWCADVDGHVLFKISPEGKILMILGNRQGVAGNNDAKDAFNRPTNTAFRANGNMYISDGYNNGRVVEYSSNGDYVGQWGKRGTGDGEFNLVHDVAVDSKGLVYVADRTNERIQVFDANGKFLAKWTNIGAPWGIYYAAKENAIYMCDGKNGRIMKFDLEGKVLGVLSSYGRAPGKLDYVHSIAVDPADGSLYTVEIKTWRVQKWVKQ
ncbi:MAG: 6-bladed beta-propeller [Opitutus sp.]|nr:6-bladed beta-propeller [Opitutus sp.]